MSAERRVTITLTDSEGDQAQLERVDSLTWKLSVGAPVPGCPFVFLSREDLGAIESYVRDELNLADAERKT